MNEYECLTLRRQGDRTTIVLDRPDSLNAVNEPLHRELSEVFRDLRGSGARVIVLTGRGKAFCAGGDLEWLDESVGDPDQFQNRVRRGQEIIRSLLNLEIPILARVNGDAVGLGATLALFCDIVVASNKARIGDPHVRVGLAAGDGAAVIWPLLTGMSRAKELLMTGELISAKKAEEIGLINYVISDEQLDSKVDEIARKFLDGPRSAIQYTKMALNGWLELGATLNLERGLTLEALSQTHPDHEEGVRAFLEGRKPEFS